MPGPTQPSDQSEDPRESTVDLPRIDLAGLADYFRGAAPPPRPAAAVQAAPGEPGSPPTSAAAESASDQSPAGPAAGAVAAATPAVARPVRPGQSAEYAEMSTTQAARPPAGSLADLRSRLGRLPA